MGITKKEVFNNLETIKQYIEEKEKKEVDIQPAPMERKYVKRSWNIKNPHDRDVWIYDLKRLDPRYNLDNNCIPIRKHNGVFKSFRGHTDNCLAIGMTLEDVLYKSVKKLLYNQYNDNPTNYIKYITNFDRFNEHLGNKGYTLEVVF